MRSKHFILLLMVLLSESKAMFYSSNLKVSWYLFSNNKRLLCNVIEDYSNIIIFGVVFYIIAFTKIDYITKSICKFLFILTVLDLIHLGLFDMQYFIILKLFLASIIYYICIKSRPFYYH